MKIPGEHVSVLIVGAGPSGLMMAAQLLRNGIQPVIIDSKKGPTDQSKALAVQARSLEIYRQMGVADRIMQQGKPVYGVSVNQDGKQAAHLSMHQSGGPQTLFPFIMMYQQSKNERLLLDYLTQNCCPVYWDTTLVSFNERADLVEALINSNGADTYLSCDWIIGADGAHSLVRKQLAFGFGGDTYQHEFYLADLTLTGTQSDDAAIFLAKEGVAAIFPMPEEARYRIIGNLPVQLTGRTDVSINDVMPSLNSICKTNITVAETHWFTTYRLHHRMAEKFNSARGFLIGDAAHIHSPVGGQGMNTGLQDAFNLAWKLSGVINRQYSPGILNSYADERIPIARELLSTTDKAFTFILSNSFWTGLLKKWFLPLILKRLWGSQKLKQAFFTRISQLGIHYHESKINLHLSPASKIIAGDRLPYLKVYDEKKQEESDLHQWCNKPGFTLIALGYLGEDELFRLARVIAQSYAGILNFFYLPPSNKNRHIFDAFEITANQQKTLIVRPDMYIGFINDSIDIIRINNYLVNIVGCVKNSS